MARSSTTLLLMAMFVALLAPSCQKAEVEDDPCAGMVGDASPTDFFVIFVDKETGENLVEANGLGRDDVKVTLGRTGQQFNHYNVIYIQQDGHPLNGAVQLSLFPHSAEGDHPYIIQMGDLVTATFSCAVGKVENGSPCRGGYYYPITAIEITDHPFKPLVYEGETQRNILVVAL